MRICIWANQILKEYLLQGYALNEARLTQQLESIDHLKKGLALIQRAQVESLDQDEAKGLLTVLTEYTPGLWPFLPNGLMA